MLSHPEISRVILTNFPGCFQFWGIRSLDKPDLVSKEQILSDAVSRTFKALSDAGKEVVYVLDVPTFSKDGVDATKVSSCRARLDAAHLPPLPLRSALLFTKKKEDLHELCSMPESENGTAEGHTLIEKLVRNEAEKYHNVHVVDLSDLICQGGICDMSKNGKVLYMDSQHLNWCGAVMAAPEIFRAFGEKLKN